MVQERRSLDPELLERQVQEALLHLYDPDYQPPLQFCIALGCSPQQRMLTVQSVIEEAIEGLRPTNDTPETARLREIHDVLHWRYIAKLTQEDTAERMHTSVSAMKRLQREAVHWLTRFLWERGSTAGATSSRPATSSPADQTAGLQAPDWRAQLERELELLKASAPDAVSDVGAVIADAIDLQHTLTSGIHTEVKVGHVQPGLEAAIHPVVLRQMLISAVRQLADRAPNGSITAFAGLRDGCTRITLACTPSGSNLDAFADFRLENIVVPQGAAVAAGTDGSRFSLWLTLPSLHSATVLVVDDNPDMARFFQRVVSETDYRIVAATRGTDALKIAETIAPRVIVLDVMLPDMDGWRLLMRFREHPQTRDIPVIVCSVVRDQELALSLGAAAYLAKPVVPQEFIRTLDRVRSPD